MKKLGWIGLICWALTACSPIPPFVDARREAGSKDTVGQSTLDRVAVCYNKMVTHKEEIEKLAETECQKTNRHAVYDGTDRFTCTLVAPTTAYFKCER